MPKARGAVVRPATKVLLDLAGRTAARPRPAPAETRARDALETPSGVDESPGAMTPADAPVPGPASDWSAPKDAADWHDR